MKFEEFEEKTIKREPVYKGQIVELVVDDVQLPSGELAKRELIFHSGAVAVIAVTTDQKIVLVKQYRKPLEKVILEIPAGKIEEADQDPLKTAKRELEEETAYQAEHFDFLMEFSTSPGFANEIIYLYRAAGLIKVDNPLPQDDDELIELHYLTLAEAKEAISQGEIYDAKTILAIQYWELQLLAE